MVKEQVLHLTKKDFIRQTFRCGGKGGQNVNKVETGVRFIHPESGARGESREERSQEQNEKIAFRRMAESPTFRAWVAEKHAEFEKKKSIEDEVKEMMHPQNLKIEFREDNKWVEENESKEND